MERLGQAPALLQKLAPGGGDLISREAFGTEAFLTRISRKGRKKWRRCCSRSPGETPRLLRKGRQRRVLLRPGALHGIVRSLGASSGEKPGAG